MSWTDYLIGKLLDKVEEVGVAHNTVIALIGDHGWQLGEHNIWGKHTNFELGARVRQQGRQTCVHTGCAGQFS